MRILPRVATRVCQIKHISFCAESCAALRMRSRHIARNSAQRWSLARRRFTRVGARDRRDELRDGFAGGLDLQCVLLLNDDAHRP